MYCVLQLLKRHGHNFDDLFFNFHKHANGYKSSLTGIILNYQSISFKVKLV